MRRIFPGIIDRAVLDGLFVISMIIRLRNGLVVCDPLFVCQNLLHDSILFLSLYIPQYSCVTDTCRLCYQTIIAVFYNVDNMLSVLLLFFRLSICRHFRLTCMPDSMYNYRQQDINIICCLLSRLFYRIISLNCSISLDATTSGESFLIANLFSIFIKDLR